MAKQKKKKNLMECLKMPVSFPHLKFFFFFCQLKWWLKAMQNLGHQGLEGRDVLNHSSSLRAGDSELCQGHPNDNSAA